MKRKLIFAATCSLLASGLSFSEIEPVAIQPSTVHVPLGFDSNDKVEIIITGKLPDTCHRRPSGMVNVNGKEITIDMKADKVSGKDVYCIKAVVPYMVSVPVGQLTEGLYSVKVNTLDQKPHGLLVDSPGSASIDNFTYANVTEVKKNQETGNIIISGEHPSNCMVVEKVDIIPNETNDTFSVLPIVTKIGEECNLVMTPFQVEVPFNVETAQDVVFHVRRIDGTAINFHW